MYLDSSALVKPIVAEPESRALRRFLRRETDRDYAHRLAVHLQERIIEYENFLTACLAIKTNPNLWKQPHE